MSQTPEERAPENRTATSDIAQQFENARNIACSWRDQATDMRAAIEEALFQATLIEAPYIHQVTEPLTIVLDAFEKKSKEIESLSLPEIVLFKLDEIKTGTFNPYEPTYTEKDAPK